MQYILTYNEQFNQDLLFMMPELSVKYYVGDKENSECEPWSILEKEDWNDTRLIICDLKKNKDLYKDRLKNLKYIDQYIWGFEFVERFDEWLLDKYIAGRKLAVWGMGNTWNNFKDKYKYVIDYYLDSNNKEAEEIMTPNRMKDWDQVFVIITSVYYDEIKEELEKYGLKEYRDFISCFDIWHKPSDMFLTMQEGKKYNNIKCLDPFSVLKIEMNGDVYPCVCGAWVPKVGNIVNQTYEEIESGVYMRLIRLSVINRTYCFCNRQEGGCALFDFDIYPNGTCENDEMRITVPSFVRKKIMAGFDECCNLKCESCREDYFLHNNSDKVKQVEEAIELKLLPKMQGAIMASMGEFFVSEQYKKLVSSQNFKHIEKLLIITNGILFDQKHWDDLRKNFSGEIQVIVSIDAASEEVYKKIRRGGDFNRLLSSLKYIRSLREANEISRFGINFVIQRLNMNDIPMFFELGEKIKVDEIYFGHLDNWGTYTDEEFESRKVFVGKSRRPKKELEDIIKECQNNSSLKINWQNINRNFRIRGFHGNGMDEFR